GLDQDYMKCIQQFATVSASGQAVTGGTGSFYNSLGGSGSQGSTGSGSSSSGLGTDLMMELVTLRKGRVPNKSEDWTYVLTGYDRNNAKQYVITVYDSYISSEGRTYKTTEQFMGYLKTLWRNKT
ncbi:MAG: hypothetical protein II704_02240, partial [Erysipelotrichaceae bacterium]|nr:hypothetical protein [Erysipelotrichaceae bacterium]